MNLTGIQDSFGFTGGTSTATIDRPEVVCDGVAPTATMIPGTANGDSVDYVINGKNVYSKGNKIKITFSEPVQKGRGNIILRQTEGWAIPPVLTAEEFNTICNQLNDDQKNILALRNSDGTLMEDVEDKKALSSDSNNNYHGTGQYVGPYKKSMHGLDANNNPDISTKFVLDFDIDITDIYEEDKLKEYSIGTTYGNNSSYTPPSDKTTTQKIRATLEVAGVHKRVLDVTSASVEIDTKNPNIAYVSFPAGLIDKTDDLPLGRKWELVIDEGAFLDMAGNSFGENNASSKAEVKMKTNSSEFFYSAGVATPVICVDRYSYGLGIKQSRNNGNLTSIENDTVAPTGYARVRIDCETNEASISYTVESSTKTDDGVGDHIDYTDNGANSYVSDTTALSVQRVTPYDSSNNCIKLALGSGSYNTSYKGIVTATATKVNFGTSSSGKEGVFQTVVYMEAPKANNDKNCSTLSNSQVSIRGTTYHDSEPRIAPFPLRDARNGSPYLRRTYIDGDNYYWVSFEILCESDFSMHSATSGGNSYNWAKNWGLMWPGELTKCEGMQNWE